MKKRKVEINIEEANKLKRKLKYAKNVHETKRINIMIAYLNGLGFKEIVNAGISATEAITNTINRYIKDPENFYKTNLKGRQKSNEWKEIEERINNIIKEAERNGEYLDIYGIQERYNKKYKNSKILNYKQTWTVVRENLKFNYQKPYIIDKRKPENAIKIVKERINEAIEKVKEKERIENGKLKNKKI